jgi:hypothetical protein
MKRKVAVTSAVLLLLPAVGPRAFAYPTSLLIMPTADVLEHGWLRLEAESDGDPTPFSRGSEQLFYTQFGLTSRLEAGLDVVGLGAEPRCELNAKWQVIPESGRCPAAAVGLLDMTRSSALSEWYVVLSKSAGSLRLRGGLLADDATRGMVGVEHWPGERAGLMAEWVTGPHAYLSAGAYEDLGGGSGALLYYGHSNTRGDGDFVGLNLSWEGAVGG